MGTFRIYASRTAENQLTNLERCNKDVFVRLKAVAVEYKKLFQQTCQKSPSSLYLLCDLISSKPIIFFLS